MSKTDNSESEAGKCTKTMSVASGDLERGDSGEKPLYKHDTIRSNIEGVDHDTYDNSTWSFRMTLLACSIALCSSQIHPLLYLTLATTIASSLDATDLSFWLLASPIIAFGAVAPFVGPLSDVFGRKPIFIFGIVVAVLGSIVSAATPSAPGFIAGQALIGAGAAIEELLAIAVVGEIVPTAKRPIYAAVILMSIVPFTPGALYGNLIATKNWRWIGLLLAIWNLLALIILVPFYHPRQPINRKGLTMREALSRIDFAGGSMLTLAVVFVSIALSWGGNEYPWSNGNVIGFLTAGLALFVMFGAWQWKGAKYPLFPRRMVYAPRPFYCTLFVVFAAGVCFIPLTAFWAIENISMYNTNRLETGVHSIPIGAGILGGAIISAIVLGVLKKHSAPVMAFFCALLTIGSACLAVADPDKIGTAMAPAVIAMIGIGGILVPNQIIITVISPDDLIGSVTALTLAVRAQAQVIGLAIFYNQLINQIFKNSYKYLLTAAIQVGWIDVEAITTMMTTLTSIPFKEFAPTVPQLQDPANYQIMHEATVKVFTASFRHLWLITMAFGIPACIAALFLGDLSHYMDHHVAAPLI